MIVEDLTCRRLNEVKAYPANAVFGDLICCTSRRTGCQIHVFDPATYPVAPL